MSDLVIDLKLAIGLIAALAFLFLALRSAKNARAAKTADARYYSDSGGGGGGGWGSSDGDCGGDGGGGD